MTTSPRPIDPSDPRERAELSPAVTRVGVRELRNNVATVLRRAAAGERVVVTVDGVPTAELAPVRPRPGGPYTLDDLVAVGLAHPRARLDHPPAPEPEDVPVDIRADAVLDALRGGR